MTQPTIIPFSFDRVGSSYLLLWKNTNLVINHHGAEISVIWLVELSAIKLLILHVSREK